MSENKYEYKKPENTNESLVDVELPSGNVIQMARPSKYSILFNMQQMPARLTEKAVEAWKQQGIGNEAEAEEVLEGTSAGDRLKMFQLSLKIRDDVIRLSRNPKLVLLEAQNPGELSVDDVSETDLDFLFKWVAAGGVASVGLAQFRNGSKQDVVDRPNRKARRAKAVAARGA